MQELDFLRAESERHHLASATRVRALEAEVAEFKALNDELSSHMDELVAAMEEQNATNARLREVRWFPTHRPPGATCCLGRRDLFLSDRPTGSQRLSAVPDVEQLREGLSRAEERAAQLSSEVEVVTSVAENLRAREAEVTEEGAAATARAEALASELAAAKLREEELEELVAALEEENPAATPSRSRTEGQLRHRLEHLERELEREQAAGEEVRCCTSVGTRTAPPFLLLATSLIVVRCRRAPFCRPSRSSCRRRMMSWTPRRRRLSPTTGKLGHRHDSFPNPRYS